MLRFFGKLFGSTPKTTAQRRTFRPTFDTLEERAVPAVDAFISFELPPPATGSSTGITQPPSAATIKIESFSASYTGRVVWCTISRSRCP
jgi:hypothetical protein